MRDQPAQCDVIDIPGNPFSTFFFRLGRDEINAWVLSTVATLIVSAILPRMWGNISTSVSAVILAVTGPVAEKPGIFLRYFLDAFREYRLAGSARQPRSDYVAKAIREGWPSLRADLLYHDPAYTVLLWLLLQVTGTQSVFGATLLALVSFVAAVAVASFLEVLYVDIRYACLYCYLGRAGFVRKKYYEARFLVDPEGDETFSSRSVLDRLQNELELPVRKSYAYRDLYVTENSLAVYNGRKPYLRFRQRLAEDGLPSKQAVQVMYTRAREVASRAMSLYRCFATRKHKFGFDFALDEDMPWAACDIADNKVRHVVQRLANAEEYNEVRFTRYVAMDPAGIFVSVDIPAGSQNPDGMYWLEIKSREDVQQLRAVSDYIAWKLPVRATTQMKCEELSGERDKPK